MESSNNAYESLLDRYPTDRIALNNLGVNYRSTGRLADAEELYRRSINAGASPAVTFLNAIPVQYELGMLDTARITIARFADEYPEHPQLPALRAAFASSRFDYEEAETILRQVDQGDPLVAAQVQFGLANLFGVRGILQDFKAAWREGYRYQRDAGLEWIRTPLVLWEALVDGLVRVSFRNDSNGAVSVMDPALEIADARSIPPADRDLLQFAKTFAMAGHASRARELTEQYENQVEQPETEAARSATLVGTYGWVALAENRFDDAIIAFREQREKSAGCQLCALVDLGRAFAAAEELDSAITYFQEYLTTPYLYRSQWDAFDLWFVLKSLGEAYEATGNREAAIEMYARFLDLWKDADNELQPIVVDVRGRIARLEVEGGNR